MDYDELMTDALEYAAITDFITLADWLPSS